MSLRPKSKGPSASEHDLVSRVLTGDPVAERELYDTHVERVYRLVFRLSGDDDVAQECTQETFIRAFDRLATFRGDSLLGTWLHSIAVSVTLNALRRVRRQDSRETDLDETASTTEGFARAEPDLRDKIRIAVGQLPDGYRTVFVMHDIEGYTHEEIGSALGISAGTSKAQLFRARGKLRRALKEFEGEWVK
jgi:RNA polymerase sigma-70 factor (ECF subfamily)